MIDRPPFDPIPPLRQGWRRIAGVTVLGIVIALAYGFLAPKWYAARVAVVPAEPSSMGGGMLSRLSGGLLGDTGLGLAAEFGLGGGAQVDRVEAIFRSRSVTDAIIEAFDLMKRYQVNYIEHARDALWEHCWTEVDRKAGVVSLSCEDKDPEIAQQMVARFGEVANAAFQRVSASSATGEREFLEKRVAQAEEDVKKAAQRLREFQEKHKLIDLTEQSKAVVTALASIKGNLISKEIELDYLDSFASPSSPAMQQTRRQIAILESKLKELETRPTRGDQSGGASGGDKDMFPPAMDVPKLRFQLEELYRDLKIQETVYLLLVERYEMAKVQEARDTPAFQILDEPVVPTHKLRPKRSIIAIFGLLAGLLLGSGWVLAPHWWRHRYSTQS